MLPPQLQHSLRQRSLSTTSTIAVRSLTSSSVRSSTVCTQARSLWGWRRPCDYASHIDPLYHRFTKYRTLRTRAKLLDKLRRRGRWDWDAAQRPFFTPKHVRLAHHIGRPRWRNYEDSKQHPGQEVAEEDGFELSQREKEWKDQMEAMRKRIEIDPYEAVFGKRFEPFWTPLVPSWMREEMGLDRSPRPAVKKAANTPVPIQPVARRPEDKAEPVKPRDRSQSPKRDDADNDVPNGQLTTYSYTSKKAVAEPDPECPNGQLTNYSYGSTTSWDSWTKKTRREEWDSISGETRRYEYDPISNRMVQVDSAASSKARDAKKVDTLKSEQSSKAMSDSQSTTNIDPRSSSQQQPPVTTAKESRQAIPVPTQTTDGTAKKTSVYFPSLLNTSVVSSSTKPSSLAPLREKDLDLLTAEDVRASMGKAGKVHTHGRPQTENNAVESMRESASASKLETSLDRKSGLQSVSKKEHSGRAAPSLLSSVARMQSKELPIVTELDDSAAHESTGDRVDYNAKNLPRQWDQQADLLQADRIRRTRGVVAEPRMVDIVQAKKAGEKNADGKPRWIDMMNARKARYDADQVAFKAAQEVRDAQEKAKNEKLKALHDAEVNEQKLHMHAHETRYVHKIRGLRQELETAYKQSSINAEMQVERIRNLENELARTQKAAGETSNVARYQTESEKYQRKIRELRKELDASFKQSSVSSGKHVERIRELEKELEKAQKSDKISMQLEKDRYVQKTKSLRDELDRTFKQSAANAEKHVERIRELEQELAESRGNGRRTRGPDAVQAEGDFSTTVTKFAKDSSKWYKQPYYTVETTSQPTEQENETTSQKQIDSQLVNDVRTVCESQYGKIDLNHRQGSQAGSHPKAQTQTSKRMPQVVEVESDVDLGKALADYEAGQTYEYRRDNLEAEIAAQEKEAHEAQELMAPESSGKLKHTIANNLKLDQDVHGARIVDDTIPRLIPTEIAARTEAAVDTTAEPTQRELNAWGIEWEDPPVYKVLAYDSGNDMFSTATTSSNFTGKETPISIPQALSQLYQPARFVPHFAELQKEGYQVVYGTKDLLVFKKVKTKADSSASTKPERQANLADHSVVKPSASETSNAVSSHAPGVNPIDGTTYPLEPESASFASPTGFVGDRWEMLEGKVQSPSTVSKAEPEPESAELKSPHPSYSQPADEDAETDIRHYPRVKREERVFSGSRLQRPKRQRRHYNEPTQEQIKEMKRKWNSWRARFRWALSVGVGASVVAYCVGAAAEHKQVQEKERWQQILEGRRGRWE